MSTPAPKPMTKPTVRSLGRRRSATSAPRISDDWPRKAQRKAALTAHPRVAGAWWERTGATSAAGGLVVRVEGRGAAGGDDGRTRVRLVGVAEVAPVRVQQDVVGA